MTPHVAASPPSVRPPLGPPGALAFGPAPWAWPPWLCCRSPGGLPPPPVSPPETPAGVVSIAVCGYGGRSSFGPGGCGRGRCRRPSHFPSTVLLRHNVLVPTVGGGPEYSRSVAPLLPGSQARHGRPGSRLRVATERMFPDRPLLRILRIFSPRRRLHAWCQSTVTGRARILAAELAGGVHAAPWGCAPNPQYPRARKLALRPPLLGRFAADTMPPAWCNRPAAPLGCHSVIRRAAGQHWSLPWSVAASAAVTSEPSTLKPRSAAGSVGGASRSSCLKSPSPAASATARTDPPPSRNRSLTPRDLRVVST